MLRFLASIIAEIGAFIASTCEIGCILFLFTDEPECPKSLIK